VERHSPFTDKDYVSPGLRVVVPDAAFPHMRPGDRWSHPWKYLRREVPHLWYADERFPLMGFLNRDEAAILHNAALQFVGRPALEIGSWLGWSTCHLALAGVRLDTLDPAHADPELRAIVEASLMRCGVSEHVTLTAGRSPEGVHHLATERGAAERGAAERGAAERRLPAGRSAGSLPADTPTAFQTWSLFFIDGDHEEPAPERDARACLPYADRDCAFLFHDLASPAVAAGLRFLQGAGFHVLVYQTAQIMGMAWRGNVTPVAHIPDPDVVWQLPHHLVGLPVSGIDFTGSRGGRVARFIDSIDSMELGTAGTTFRAEMSTEALPTNAAGRAGPTNANRPAGSVCIVSAEIIGPFKNGGIGTSMTGLAEHLADSGWRVTILYTGAIWTPDVPLRKWQKRYAELGIRLEALSIEELTSIEGPLKDRGFAISHLVYRYLTANPFDVVHFNDCGGEGSLCLVAKKLGLAFQETLLLVALHSPSEWVLDLNQTLPTSLLLSAYHYAERLSVKTADVLWSPSRYLLDWAMRHGFELPEQTFVQQYCIPSQRLREAVPGRSASGSPAGSPAASRQSFPEVIHGRTAPPNTIVFFGRLEERKGLRLFCNAIHALRVQLAERGITVTFLGKAETCGGMNSLAYIARRTRAWRFPVKTITDLGQPEALAYLLSGGKLAVMSAPIDNSPCTVYEALAWGIPFLAARTGGVPELIQEADHDAVLFDYSTESLRQSLLSALDGGGFVAAPSRSQGEIRQSWSSFHASAGQFLPKRENGEATPPTRVMAIVDARSALDLRATLESMEAIHAIHRVVVLNRDGIRLPPTSGSYSVRNIDLLIDDPEALDEELASLTDEAVLMIHSGVTVLADRFDMMLEAFGRARIDGFLPAAEIVSGGSRRIVPSLGGDPSFMLFEGVTFTGGLLVRGDALRRAKQGRGLAVESAFMGLADFCVTRRGEIWPYPEPVFVHSGHLIVHSRSSLPARVKAYDECPPADRYYMLAAGYGAMNPERAAGKRLQVALAMIDLGLAPLVRAASWALRRLRALRSRLSAGRLERLWR
jgi:glycosyltransferase involved in cell wall biosynthesis